MKKQTAGRDALSGFADQFAALNDDVLFGEIWSREKELSPKLRSIVTIVSLVSQGLCDSSLTYHLQEGKKNGITRSEIAEILTHNAFYAGWPKAWAAFRQALTVWNEDSEEAGNTGKKELSDSLDDGMEAHAKETMFPIGESNDGFAQFFSKRSWLAPICTKGVPIFNVTFEPGCQNNWHIHHADKGGGQILLAVSGKGLYQEWGKDPVEMNPGDMIYIAPGIKHWHGAAPDSWFSHLAIEVPGENASNEWLEPSVQ